MEKDVRGRIFVYFEPLKLEIMTSFEFENLYDSLKRFSGCCTSGYVAMAPYFGRSEGRSVYSEEVSPHDDSGYRGYIKAVKTKDSSVALEGLSYALKSYMDAYEIVMSIVQRRSGDHTFNINIKNAIPVVEVPMESLISSPSNVFDYLRLIRLEGRRPNGNDVNTLTRSLRSRIPLSEPEAIRDYMAGPCVTMGVYVDDSRDRYTKMLNEFLRSEQKIPHREDGAFCIE